VDLKSKKLFLKKSACPPHSTVDDYFVGSKVLLYGREMELVDYGDTYTKTKLQFHTQQAIIILTQELSTYWGKILEEINASFGLVKIKSVLVSSNVGDNICRLLQENPRKGSLLTAGMDYCDFILFQLFRIASRIRNAVWGCVFSPGVNIFVVAQAEDGVANMVRLASSITDKYGAGVFAAADGTQVSELQSLLASNQLPSSVTLDSSTCCVIKPHAVKAKAIGPIIDIILTQGYEISAISTTFFDKVQAEEFLEVYNGVVPEYPDLVIQLSAGNVFR
jgi:nucleoside-diphosphate kinase